MDVGVAALFGLVRAGVASEYDIGNFEQSGLAAEEFGGGEAGRKQFVHAVVNHCGGVERVQKRQGHRRVEPGDVPVRCHEWAAPETARGCSKHEATGR